MAVYLKGERADEASLLGGAAELLGRVRSPVIGGRLASTPPSSAALKIPTTAITELILQASACRATLPPAQIGFKQYHV
jgi:hypothetical protein